tara:strand:+ start:508 stop:732 length:225 start_codon:yes stop_codon:yes gene_type:complete
MKADDEIQPEISLTIKHSPWESFVQEIWMKHKDEIMEWEQRQVDYTLQDYYQQHKWFLRRLFRAEGGKVNTEQE